MLNSSRVVTSHHLIIKNFHDARAGAALRPSVSSCRTGVLLLALAAGAVGPTQSARDEATQRIGNLGARVGEEVAVGVAEEVAEHRNAADAGKAGQRVWDHVADGRAELVEERRRHRRGVHAADGRSKAGGQLKQIAVLRHVRRDGERHEGRENDGREKGSEALGDHLLMLWRKEVGCVWLVCGCAGRVAAAFALTTTLTFDDGWLRESH